MTPVSLCIVFTSAGNHDQLMFILRVLETSYDLVSILTLMLHEVILPKDICVSETCHLTIPKQPSIHQGVLIKGNWRIVDSNMHSLTLPITRTLVNSNLLLTQRNFTLRFKLLEVQLNVMLHVQCVVPEKVHTHPVEGYWKFQGGGGFLKANFLEPMYENKPEFPGGRGGGGAKQKPSMGRVWIFSGTAQ